MSQVTRYKLPARTTDVVPRQNGSPSGRPGRTGVGLESGGQEKGFTLIELLVVIAIIAALASIVLVSMNSARIKSRDARRIGDIRQIQAAMLLYAEANSQVYPTSLDDLDPTYMPKVPPDPKTGSPYYYSYDPATPGKFHLAALLEDSAVSALRGDEDDDSSGWAGGSTFKGLSSDCDSTVVADPSEKCYDVTYKTQ